MDFSGKYVVDGQFAGYSRRVNQTGFHELKPELKRMSVKKLREWTKKMDKTEAVNKQYYEHVFMSQGGSPNYTALSPIRQTIPLRQLSQVLQQEKKVKQCSPSAGDNSDVTHIPPECKPRPGRLRKEEAAKKVRGAVPESRRRKNFCSPCRKQFKNLTSFRAHQRSHDSRFPCPIPKCMKNYSRRATLKAHVEKVHKRRLAPAVRGRPRKNPKQTLKVPTGCENESDNYDEKM